MLIKYRVHEVAADLNIPNKEVIDTLRKYTGQSKKHMTALSEDELNLVFEAFTQHRNFENLNTYFAEASKRRPVIEEEKPDVAIEPEKVPAASGKPKAQAGQQIRRPVSRRQPRGGAVPTGQRAALNGQRTALNGQRAGQSGQRTAQSGQRAGQSGQRTAQNGQRAAQNGQRFPQQAGQRGKAQQRQRPERRRQPAERHSQPQRSLRMGTSGSAVRPAGRIVDTHASHVELDRYNEKYDRLASEKIRPSDNVIRKQKLTQRSSQYRRGRNRYSHRETEAERLRRIAQERKNKHITIKVPEKIRVGELAMRLKATAAEVIKKLMNMGVFAAVNDEIDFDTASLVAMEFHAKVEKEVVVTIEDRIIDDSDDKDVNLVPRAPIVVVMGHVDHGKTSLLDAIRHTNVTATEAGGITQRIGAYQVKVNGRDVTFLDTPGHEAFTTMRARGAQVTDIAVLVVAADDGIMPQTIEAIHHAKAAKVSIIVAINKMDKPGANPEAVMEGLTKYDLVPEEWGGKTPCVKVSAVKKTGIKELLETILLVADVKDLKANPDRAAKGTVLEARIDKGRGPVATVLIQNGTLHTGDILVAGTTVGRVRAMTDENGKSIRTAGPSVPAEITGLDDVPMAGDTFDAVTDERLARELVAQRRAKKKEEKFNSRTKVTLDNLFDQMKKGDMKELQLVVKADVQGSAEAVCQSLQKLSNDEVRVDIIHSGVGAISESDVMLAAASKAIIIGFNVRPDPVAEENAKRDGVEIRLYRVIYDCINEISAALKGMLAPKVREVSLGRAEVRQVYRISSVGTVAGVHIVSGKITRSAKVRVVRDGTVLAEDQIASLKRFKDDVKEVLEGYDCGIVLEKYSDIHVGDIFEIYTMEEYRET